MTLGVCAVDPVSSSTPYGGDWHKDAVLSGATPNACKIQQQFRLEWKQHGNGLLANGCYG